jgi:hypothetical protein
MPAIFSAASSTLGDTCSSRWRCPWPGRRADVHHRLLGGTAPVAPRVPMCSVAPPPAPVAPDAPVFAPVRRLWACTGLSAARSGLAWPVRPTWSLPPPSKASRATVSPAAGYGARPGRDAGLPMPATPSGNSSRRRQDIPSSWEPQFPFAHGLRPRPAADPGEVCSDDCLTTWDAAADVKKNWGARRPICHARCSQHCRSGGIALHFLARVGVPHEWH